MFHIEDGKSRRSTSWCKKVQVERINMFNVRRRYSQNERDTKIILNRMDRILDDGFNVRTSKQKTKIKCLQRK